MSGKGDSASEAHVFACTEMVRPRHEGPPEHHLPMPVQFCGCGGAGAGVCGGAASTKLSWPRFARAGKFIIHLHSAGSLYRAQLNW